MNNINKKDQNKIDRLKEIIETKKKENRQLELQKKRIKEQTLRYQEIFNNSYLSIWEENPSEVYKIMESLPCNNGKELSYFLSSNTETLIQMISQLTIIGINSYTVILFGASNKTDFLETLKKGQLLTPEAFPGFIKIFAAMIDKKSYVKTEITTNKKNGEKLKLLVTSYIPGQGNGNMLISMMDITKIKDREDFVRDSIIMASEQRKRSEVLQSILLTLTYSLNREKILNAILLEAKKIVPYSTANIRLLQNKKLNVVASVGYENFEAADFIKQSSISTKEFGDAEKYLDTGTINIIADTNVDPGWKVFPETSFIRGYIGIPFKWKGEISGLLSLDSDKTGTFLESDIEKLEPFAHAVTVALQSSHLFETIKIELEKRKQIELSIKKSLGEKEILLKEIHHRVKNNLTLIMSLINLQSDMLSNNINPNIFEGLKQRIYTISLVHERLYNSKNLSSIELKSYLIDLTSSIRTLSLFKEGIEFKMNMKDDIEIKSDTLIPLALLLNELIINSVKYAFPNEPGIISIDVSEEDGDYEIVFKDNGIGIPEDREQSSSQMGLFLVESLVAQIDGSVSFHNDEGAVTTIIFPQK